jgi:sigma-B regulation protein RsbU (phosphoserine phosphatase)
MLEEVKEKERLAQEMELARQIQESLLPASSQRHGAFVVHATFHPAAEVGGDAFDVFSPADGRLQVMVADVAGHGLSTGLLMASLKATVATLLDEGYSGKDLIRRVNSGMLEQQRQRTMATLAVIDANADRNRLHLANAGHPPPYLIEPDGTSRELMAGALPLGTRLCQPASLESSFPPGARVVLYSDGLVEAENPSGEIFGFDRLAALLETNGGLDSGALLGTVVNDWKSWIGGQPARDDMTVVILERTDDG